MVSDKTKGILCILSAAFCFALMNLFIKLSGDIPTLQKAFFRNVVAVLVSFILLRREHISLNCAKGNWSTVIGRAIWGTVGIFCNFYAIDHLNISDASMLNKLSPFFAILFSYIILKERAKPYQLACVGVALAGTCFILKPSGAGLISMPALIGMISGIAAGLAYTLLRKATEKGVPKAFIIFFFSSFSCLASIPYCIINYTPMSAVQLVFLLLTGLAATGGQFSITAAYSFAPARELSVYDYTQVIFAGILGFCFLAEIPDYLSILGYFTIIAAAVFMFIKGNRQPA
ncbi:MAG: DMT family transporter [Lachnospiraceae bacterium]|nr:DMT family transporter [Lachnospiraceae bacterium]